MPPRQPNPQQRTIGTSGGRVLGEITNVQAYSSDTPRPSSAQSKVSSAIQHFSRITAAATSSSNRPVTSRLTDIETNGNESNSTLKQQQSEEYLQRETAYDLQSSPESARAKFVSSSSPVHTDDDYCDERITDKRVSQASTGTNSSSTSSGGRRKTHVGPWRLGRTLGRGSSGRVRLAKHAETGRLAAVKIVPKSANFDESDDKSGKKGKDAAGLPYGIEREVIIMKLIEHPNVMGLYDVWENRGELYLILEYVEGGELFDYLIKRGRLEEKEAVHYFRQIILGMDYCHKFNICHRDLKPENLLIDKYHNIKIADFGMAALETSGKMLETSCGSPHYASPEIVAGKTYHGAPSDIWSCGVILFALLTGHLPFDDDNIRNLLMKVQAGRFQMPSDLSIHAKDLIWRILKTNPEERITAAEILEHTLLKKYPSQELPAEVFSHTLRVDRPVRSIEEIDLEIVKNLQTLWHGEDKNVIIQRLLSAEPNSEKTFYCLLMKYRHDHLANISADNTPRSSPQHQAKLNSSSSKLSSRVKVAKSVQPTTPSRPSRHRTSPSKGSVISVSSVHKRGVDFSHVRKKSIHSSSSTPSIKSQHSTTRARLGPEPEPPLPQSSSLLIAAIDQLTFSLSRGPATTGSYQATAIAQTSSNQTPIRLSSSPASPPPALSPSLSSSPPPSEASSPVVPLHKLEYTVRSAKEGPAKKSVSIGILDDDDEDDRVRKISAEFASSICERAFNSTRYSTDSSKDSGSRSTSATSASTAPSSVGGHSPMLIDDSKFSPPLQLSFEPIMSTVGVADSVAKDEWVREFEQYLENTGRVPQVTKGRSSAALAAISEESPASVDNGRFIDAEEDDVDVATEIESLLNTPPVLKRRTTANTTRTASSTPTYSVRSDSRAGSSTVSLEYSRLQISSIVNTETFYEFNQKEAETGIRRVSAASTATTGTTIRHPSLTSAVPSSTIPEEPSLNEPASGSQCKPGPIPVSGVFERQKPFNKSGNLKPKVRSLREKLSSNDHRVQMLPVESQTSASKESSFKPANSVVLPVPTPGPSYGKYTPLILDFEEDIAEEEHNATKSDSAQPQPLVSHPSPQKPVSLPRKDRLVAPPAIPVKVDEGTKWVKFQKHLMPKRAAPPPPTAGQSENTTKKPKLKKKKKTRESDMFEGVLPKPYTSRRPMQNWFSKVLNGIL